MIKATKRYKQMPKSFYRMTQMSQFVIKHLFCGVSLGVIEKGRTLYLSTPEREADSVSLRDF
jgi:hypothetical protein